MTCIAYYRTSTKDQVNGLEAQRNAIKSYLNSIDGQLLAEYEEQETGTSKRMRIEIYKAIEQCKATGSTLIVHKIDRIARDLKFWVLLQDANIQFLSLDNIGQSKLVANILMSVASAEHEMIKERQRNAYKVMREKGIKLGNTANMLNPKSRLKAISISAKNRKEMSLLKHSIVIQHSKDYLKLGMSYTQIAKRLNEIGYRTAKKCLFTCAGVYRLIKMSESQ